MSDVDERTTRLQALYPQRDEQWDDEAGGWLVRELPDGAVVHVVPLTFTTAIIVSARRGAPTYVDRWCYTAPDAAFDAADAWAGPYPGSEPGGWHRHPMTGRRRPDGDPDRQYVAM